jgi:hypothetical protein
MNTSLSLLLRRLTLLCSGLVVLALNPCAAFTIFSTPPPNPGLPLQWSPGDSVTLSVSSSPAPIGSLQWLHDEQPIPGATAASLTLSNLASPDSGNYRLRVTSGNTTEFSDTTLTVNVLPPPVGASDPTFISALPRPISPTSYISVGPFASDGSMIVTNSGYDAPISVLRLSTSGSLVTTFNFPTAAGMVLAGFPDGSLVVTKAPYLLNADGSANAFTLPPVFDATQPLTSAAVASDGKFYLAQRKVLVRFLADGTVDPAFAFSASLEKGISSLQLDRNDRLYVLGQRAASNPGDYPQLWPVFYRVTASGAVDSGFAEQTAVLLVGSLQVTPLDDGRILYYSAYHGYRSWKILRDDGTADPSWTGDTAFSERPIVVNRATQQVYLVDTSYKLRRYTLTATGSPEDTQFFPGTQTLTEGGTPTLAPDGKIFISGWFTEWENRPAHGLVRLLPNAVAGVLPPNAFATPYDAAPSRGETFTLSSTVAGTGPFTYRWLALDGQPLPAVTSSPQLTLSNFSAANLGRYQLRVTGPGGVTFLSNVARAILSEQSSYLTNLSGRAMTGTGEDMAIAGLTTKISAGALGLPTLLRGAGPALKSFGVSNFLSNPALDLFSSAGQLIANNDQWSVNPDISTASAAAGAFSFAPGSNDAALLYTFPTGRATVVLKNQSGDSGVGLLEIYQLFPTGFEYYYQSLLNLSFRARTSPGEGTAIAGFVIVDPKNFDRPAKVLLRAIGPTLGSYGIQHPLTNPILTVYNSKGEVVATNDDWAVNNSSADAVTLAAAMKQVGAFDLTADSKDSALLLNLPAGAYSMQASGGTGVVLLEVYLVR